MEARVVPGTPQWKGTMNIIALNQEAAPAKAKLLLAAGLAIDTIFKKEEVARQLTR